jgi:WD40 repeat protein
LRLNNESYAVSQPEKLSSEETTEQIKDNLAAVPAPGTDTIAEVGLGLEETTESLMDYSYLATDAQTSNQPEEGFDFSPTLPGLFSFSTSSFGKHCTKGCSWFPSGNQILVPCEDARYRIFDISEGVEDIECCGSIKETEMIYDYCWDGEGSRFLSTGRYQPVHLWDPSSGELVATYKCFNHLDEIAHSFSLSLLPGGAKFITGLKNQIRTFDLSRPGRVCDINVTGKKCGEGQVGIISSLSVNPDMNLIAAGSYSKTVGLYSLTGSLVSILAGHRGGVTQVSFSPDNRRLYSGARKDDDILCWDIRNTSQLLYSLQREVSTNQRIGFGFAGDHLVSGGTDGCIRIWDSLGEIVSGYLLHPDSVPGLSVHPTLPLIATSSGQRHSDPKSVMEETELIAENSLKIWNFSTHRT